MKRLLFWLLILTALPVFSQTPKVDKLCVVISGNKKDHNNFLDEDLFKSGGTIAGVNCKVFGNWVDAKKFAHEHLMERGKLMVIQGAHGLNDGTYEVNEGPLPNAVSIYKDLKELSGSFHVGSVIHSCFSAAVMNEKLLDDEASNVGLDQLCLISSSSFGRITYSHPNDIIQNLLKLRPGESLERPFINNPGGIISSAAWSEVSLPQFLMSKQTAAGFKTLEKMDLLMRGNAECKTPADFSAAVCLSPEISDETYEDVRAFIDPKVPEHRKGYFESNFKTTIETLEFQLKQEESNIQVKDELICRKEILQNYQDRFGDKLKGLKTYPDVMSLRDEMTAMPFYKNHCMKFLATPQADTWKKESLLTESFHTGIEEYMKSLDRLEKKYKAKNPGGEFSVHDFIIDSISPKVSCSPAARDKMIASKEKIVQSLFGVDFFDEEYVTSYDGAQMAPDDMLDSKVSTQIILKGFQNSALLKPSLKDIKDQKRRKACQNFKF